ncbi:zinc finger protein Gfi-1b [Drosophila innubila]|uniref:zinc finger protein Gfi-1b n=1 Tax=Drosophila innubila TaxID=198719 RepID=UPI00148BD7F1|nr:zinc finger protein Gfi-1b [Drosophila innubila]
MSSSEDKLILAEMGLELCRVCNVHSTQCLSLYKPHTIAGELTTLAALLSDCANLQILEDEQFLPSHICQPCVEMLAKVRDFKRMALRTDAMLRKRHARQFEISSRSRSSTPTPAKSQPQESMDAETEADTDEYVYVLEETESLEAVVAHQEDVPVLELRFDTPSPKVELLEVDFDSAEDYAPEQEQQQAEEQQSTLTENCVKQRAPQRRKSHNPSLQCQICGKQLSTSNSFKYHMQLHGDNRPFVCSICGESFKTRNAYDGHVTVHNPNNPNKCTICGKTYRQASSLRSHLLSHSGVKPFTCDICGKGLTQKSGYKKHMLTHTGEKPHNCDTCGRSFRYSSNLIAHKRSHTRKSPSCLTKLLTDKSPREGIE